MSHDGFNQTRGWKSIIVVAISTSAAQGKRGLTVVELPAGTCGLTRRSFAVCHQVTTFDRAKLVKTIGALQAGTLV
jgi:mRNA-degrading endonuclease toxin of MazEF toxin-antitoxin module